RGDRVGKVFAGRLLEIEQDRQIIALAELVSNRVENHFSLRREAAENEHHFGSDGVNDTADFLVIQKQVDELRHFQIVNLDRGFVVTRDHQVRLDSSFQPYVPRGDSIYVTSRQICSFRVSVDQSRRGE